LVNDFNQSLKQVSISETRNKPVSWGMFLEDWHFAWIELFILIFLLKGVWKVIFVFNSCATIRSTLLLMAPKQSKHEKKGDGYGASSSILFV